VATYKQPETLNIKLNVTHAVDHVVDLARKANTGYNSATLPSSFGFALIAEMRFFLQGASLPRDSRRVRPPITSLYEYETYPVLLHRAS
jgi:hypothetical protein